MCRGKLTLNNIAGRFGTFLLLTLSSEFEVHDFITDYGEAGKLIEGRDQKAFSFY